MKKPIRLGEILELLRDKAFSRKDEQSEIIFAPECESWTWITFNLASGVLDLLQDVLVDEMDVDDGCIRLWVKTKSYNEPETREPKEESK